MEQNNLSNDRFVYQGDELQLWFSIFRENLVLVSCATVLPKKNEMSLKEIELNKPIYLSVMANRQQLQPILDNPHLFDKNFIDAVQKVINGYDNGKFVE